MLVLAYVDDNITAGPDRNKILEFKRKFHEILDITDGGDLHFVLGIRVTRNPINQTITLDQTTYIRDVIRRFRMADSHPVSTPLNPKGQLSSNQSPTTDDK